MKRNKEGIGFYYIVLGLLLFAIIVIAASIGSANIGPLQSLKIIATRIPFVGKVVDVGELNPAYETIVFEVRLPRILLSGLVGGGLAVTGATFQGLFQNPLADPHILGVSSGASFGATIAILGGVGLSLGGMNAIGALAFVGALVTVFVVYHLSFLGGRVKTTSILLTGTAVSTMLSAFVSLLMTFHQQKIDQVYMWTLGSFTSSSWSKILYLLPIVIVCSAGILCFGQELNLILTGEEVAESLGVNTARVKKILIVLCSLLVAGCVSVSGIIGFVGLIIPHCIRLVVGPDNKRVLPLSILGGAIWMIFSDTIARTVAAPTEIPVGVITSIFGGPYFVYLLYRNQKEAEGKA